MYHLKTLSESQITGLHRWWLVNERLERGTYSTIVPGTSTKTNPNAINVRSLEILVRRTCLIGLAASLKESD